MLSTIVLAAGCHFTGGVAGRGGSPADSIDAPRMRDAPADASTPDAARDCLASWETGPLVLSAPQLLSELSGGSYDRDPFVTPDELTIYWSSKRSGDTVPHIYRATRAHWADPFGGITLVSDLDSAATDGKMSMTADGKDVLFASDRSGNFDIWEATRSTAQGTFGTPNKTLLTPAVDSSSDQLDPAMSWDGLTLYWADSISGHQQVIVSSRTTRASAFGSTTIAVDNPAGVADPAVSRDDRVLLFTENTASNEADIFYATRATPGGALGAAFALSIDTIYEEGDAFLSYDACDLFFASSQQSPNVYQLYVAHVQ